jgi:DNA-binding beta-propeller fold protein YncE
MFKTMIAVAALTMAGWATPAAAYPYIYVPDSSLGTLTVVDAATNTIVRTVSNLVGAYGVTVNPDGSRIYVTEGTNGKVVVLGQAEIDIPSLNPLIGTFSGLGNPVAVAVSPDGKRLFVADAQNDQAVEIYMPTLTLAGIYAAAGPGLSTFALDPAGRRLALASGSGNSGTVRLYTLDSGNHIDIALQSAPEAMTFSSDGATLWIATASGLIAYDPATGNQTPIAIIGGAGAIAYSARAQAVYVAARSSNTVFVYPAAGGAPITISLSAAPTGLALSPDGTRAYATFPGGMVVIDTSSHQVINIVNFGQNQAVDGDFVGPGDIWANNTLIASSVGRQISATVTANDFLSRPLSFNVIKQPANGTLNFTPSTGDYVYTPPAGYSRVESFVWEATATNGGGSPTVPASNPITTTLLIKPTLSTFSAQRAAAGSTLGPLGFTLQGSMPLQVSISSTNKRVIDSTAAQISSGCGTSTFNCTLTLTAGNAKGQTATVTVTATDPSGVATRQTFRVTINGSSGGGGGSLSWPLLIIFAGLVFLRRRSYEHV